MITLAAPQVDVEVPLLPEYAELFPLPLSFFERFLLQDERPGYPMVFYVEMVFLGRMNHEALTESIRDAAARHPLLLARVVADREGWKWVLPPKGIVPVDFQDPQRTYVPPRGPTIDLRRESGLRVWIQEDGERTSVLLQIHHACCDGEGSRHFGFDFMTGYARRTGETASPDWTRVEYARLQDRAIFQPATSDQPVARTTLWRKIRDGYDFHVLGSSPLAAPAPRPTSNAATPERPVMLKHLFSRQETQQFQQRASDTESALNDVAIALLFQTLADWNQKNSRAAKSQRIRLLMPTDLRERADRWLTAANRVGFSFLCRTIGQCDDWSSLVPSISQETKYIKGVRLGLDFLQILGAVQRIPYLLPMLLRLPRCMATSVLTNLGDTTRRFRSRFPITEGFPIIGDVRLEQVAGVPPLRAGTHSGFGICLCAGHMALTIRTDPARLAHHDATALLANYVAAWKDWAACGDRNH